MTRTILPPISTFDSPMPVLSLDLTESNKLLSSNQIHDKPKFLKSPGNSPQSQSKNDSRICDVNCQERLPGSSPNPNNHPPKDCKEKELSPRPAQFTIEEDLEIVKCVFAFYKHSLNKKIPWSFWQVYRRATGTPRSNPSLYHHWEGSICKKYGVFIKSGKLQDCIHFIEAQIAMEKGTINHFPNSKSSANSGTPLGCRRSQTHDVFQDNMGYMSQPQFLNMNMGGVNNSQFNYNSEQYNNLQIYNLNNSPQIMAQNEINNMNYANTVVNVNENSFIRPSPLMRNFSAPGFGVNQCCYPPFCQ